MLTISQLLKLSQVLGHDAVWWDLIWIWRPFREKGCCYCCSFFLVSVFKIQCYVSQGHETYACIQYKKRNLEDTENTFTTPHARTHPPTHPPESQLLHIWLNYKHNGFPNYNNLPMLSLDVISFSIISNSFTMYQGLE